jgi:glycosyltransferase involved in cell wall biosynthesis
MKSPLAGMRVAYVPYSQDLSGPGDRRRFCRYAELRQLDFEVARPGVAYDVVVLSSLADVTYWSRLPVESTRVVYEIIDSYLEARWLDPRALLRGTMKYVLGQHAHLEPSYRQSLRRMFRRADAVVCSTPEQQAKILIDNRNTHPILDFHANEVRRHKTTYARSLEFKLVWEGLPGNLVTFTSIARVLREFAGRTRTSLSLITDATYPIAGGPFPRLSTQRLISRYLPGVTCALHPWSIESLTSAVLDADLAVIPMIRQPIYWAKPENKLLLLWRFGIPVLTAATPAYVRAMNGAGLDLACRTEDEWRGRLALMAEDQQAREAAGRAGRAFVETEHSEDSLVEKWDNVFASLSRT